MICGGWSRALRRLIEEGILETDTAIAGRITVVSASRSNQVGILSVDGETVLVFKRHEIVVDDIDPFEAEVAAYRWLEYNSTTAALAPHLIMLEGRVIVLEALIGFRPFYEVLASSANNSRLLDALWRQLAILHTADFKHELHARRPWVLAVPNGVIPKLLAPDPSIGPFVAEIAADTSLRSAIEELDSMWKGVTPIHGDIKFDNIFVKFDDSSGKPSIALFDWELAGLGLPAWDLAGVLDGLIIPALQCVDIDTALGQIKHAVSTLEVYRFLADQAFPTDNRLLIIATIVRLVQSTIQLFAMRHFEPECEQSARRVLDGARTLAKRLAKGEAWPAYLP